MPTRHRRELAGGGSFARPRHTAIARAAAGLPGIRTRARSPEREREASGLDAVAVAGARSGITQTQAIERKPNAARILDRIEHESRMLNRSRSRDCRINDRRDGVIVRTSL